MDKIRNFIDSVSAKLANTIDLLDAMFFKFQSLMALNNDQLRIVNNNQTILANDPVYNNPLTPAPIKQAIATRTLQNMIPLEFEDAYKSILYGVSSENPPETRPEDKEAAACETKPSEPEEPTSAEVMALIDKQVSLDLVPLAIDPQTAILAGHTQAYLLRKCREHAITLRRLYSILELKKEYKTNLQTILSLLEQDFTFEEIDSFFSARQQLELRDPKIPVTIVQLVALTERFADMTIGDDFLVETIADALEKLGRTNPQYERNFPGVNLNILMAIADRLRTPYLECVLDWLEECTNEPKEKGYSEYPELTKFKDRERILLPPKHQAAAQQDNADSDKEINPEEEQPTDGVTDFTTDPEDVLTTDNPDSEEPTEPDGQEE